MCGRIETPPSISFQIISLREDDTNDRHIAWHGSVARISPSMTETSVGTSAVDPPNALPRSFALPPACISASPPPNPSRTQYPWPAQLKLSNHISALPWRSPSFESRCMLEAECQYYKMGRVFSRIYRQQPRPPSPGPCPGSIIHHFRNWATNH